MFDTFWRSWELGKQSLAVLRHEKQLVIFPLLSSIALVLVLASFTVPLLAVVDVKALMEKESAFDEPIYYGLLFVFYFVNYLVMAFFNSALIACAINRFNGDDADLMTGLKAATSRLPQILGWATLAATVGVLLRIVADRAGPLGRWVISLVGMGWSIATYFVVPVLVVEGVGPVTAVKRSVGILRKTWGESLVSNVGLSALTTVATFIASVPLVAGIILSVLTESFVYGAVGLAVTVVLWILVSLISSTLNVILLAAIYRYATTGLIPQHFDGATLRQKFRVERN